ncbi:N-acetylmuramoyl-L-alanine amidase [Alphaproteobacteria bacterium]|nr:N-acetylmuramoyl-L-alanine amidase [Alphaproteobacteria bacterium]MDA9590522.1 N-acetylmuramoyl-L-alanine amidase [Alphaproteobacteria bacterium]MDB2461829.1 N-acetylmuramoyl-L-alanine amidase [Alphaproteobacteria bacterium]MDB2487115.1 N-acetylmuramoyl-L-alanine amidase [Alphaproteobacteria bacterium]MDB2488034.1 N-acetylmuramoyl-L-alanine amidase [Alphaproteobacteria bacterium]
MIGLSTLFRTTLLALTLLSSSLVVAAAESATVAVNDIRLGVTAERTRLVLDLGAKVDFDIFLLDRPRRVVVDLPSLAWPTDQPTVDGLVQKIRFGQFTADKSRLVIDAKGPVRVVKSFLLPPSSGLPHRLVIDLVKTGNKEFADQVAKDRAAKRSAKKAAPAPTPFTPKPRKQANSKPVIVLDAGHGGVDPGALGRKAREKSVTLNFTRELAKQLRKTGKYKVYLTRNRDIYIPLRQRVNIARKHNADLFISIHADAIKRKNVRGMSIYTLSETASDKEAAALAKKENQSDIIAGIDFADQPPEVANILIDLAQRETKNLSVKFANLVVDNARGKTRLLDRTHRFAGFRVLKAPDVPSVLIELGFLTNRSDEKQLLSTAWRRKVAGALVNSVNGFFVASRLAALR